MPLKTAPTRDSKPALPAQPQSMPFASSMEHLLAEIGRVELFVRWQLERMRQGTGGAAELKGLVITEQDVADLLDRAPGSPPFAAQVGAGASQEALVAIQQRSSSIAERKRASLEQGIDLRLITLQQRFSLSELDLQCLVVCLAVEVDPRFAGLYGYLQDDATRRYASVDLVLNLVCGSLQEKIEARERVALEAPLLRHRLLHLVDDPAHGDALLYKSLRVEEQIVRYLLGSNQPDPRLAAFAYDVAGDMRLEDLVLPTEMKGRLRTFISDPVWTAQAPWLHLQGSYGCGRQATARAICHGLDRPLLCVDLDALPGGSTGAAEGALGLAMREARLLRGALYLDHFGNLLPEEKAPLRRALLRELQGFAGLVFLASESVWHPGEESGAHEVLSVRLERPDFTSRVELWRKELTAQGGPEDESAELANKFRMTGGQIQDAARTAKQSARWRDPGAVTTAADLHEACRIHSSRKLSSLGQKIKPHHQWDDLVLPEDRTRHLREICNCVKYRAVVFDQWGFEGKLSLGKGLNMLFAGPSGTGKTMAAEIMAREVGLDVYKIDLSTVVSKYIGETEKNLARIFAEAETSNAILFFDEADALFGKRSEVRDSHDRYANIEINYLLQKMEEHEGVVILATNFRKNMDDAFMRRLHFTVEFPLPCEADRRRIWERVWPETTPQAADLDFGFMARRFELPGGNIRNVALAAAFLAASDGGVVTMSHLLHGTRREYQKMGKVVSQGEFQ